MVSFPEFLKKFTAIPNKFIDDFFEMFENTKNFNNNYFISLDKICLWLSQTKGNIKRTLLDNFSKNIDYTLKKIKLKNGRGRTSEEILLTPTTFKKLCMMLRNKKSKEVRDYFIKVEETLDKYKNYTIEGLEKEMKKMSKNLKPREKPSKGVIYGFEINENNRKFIKIGKSKDFLQRIKQHNSSHAHKIDVEFLFETDNFSEVEICIKGIMKKYQYRKGKEVYELPLSKIKELTEKCDKLVKNFYKEIDENNNILLVIDKN